MRVALINDFLVKEIRDLQSEEEIQDLAKTHQCVFDITNMEPEPKVGYTFDGKTILYPPDTVFNKKITRLAFRNRFTPTEKATMYAAASQNNANGYAFKSYLDDLAAAMFVDLSRADTIASVQLLATYQIITTQRASEILNNPIQDHERYQE